MSTTHTTRRRWTRRAVIFLGAFLAMVLGFAAALYMGTAPITGSAKGADEFAGVWAGDPTIVNTSDMSCHVHLDKAGEPLEFSASKAYPGGSCVVEARVMTTGGQGQVAGVDLELPDGWTVALTKGCGATATELGGGASGATVRFEVSVGQNAPFGQSSTFGPGDGVRVTPMDTQRTDPLPCQQ